MLFYGLAIFTGLFAVATVLTKNILHSAVYLMGVLTCSAGLYLVLGAEFLAGVQILVYVGGVIVLLVFAVMLTKSQDLIDKVSSGKKIIGLLVGGSFFTGSCLLLSSSFREIQKPTAATIETAELGRKLLSADGQGYLLPFELISILLLAVLIGGIVIARHDQEGANHE